MREFAAVGRFGAYKRVEVRHIVLIGDLFVEKVQTALNRPLVMRGRSADRFAVRGQRVFFGERQYLRRGQRKVTGLKIEPMTAWKTGADFRHCGFPDRGGIPLNKVFFELGKLFGRGTFAELRELAGVETGAEIDRQVFHVGHGREIGDPLEHRFLAVDRIPHQPDQVERDPFAADLKEEPRVLLRIARFKLFGDFLGAVL